MATQGPILVRLAVFARLSKAIALLVFALGALGLLGWAADSQFLKSVTPYYVPMKPNTALAFLAAGAALWATNQRAQIWAAAARLLAVAAAAIGGLTLLECVSGLNLHIDELPLRYTGTLIATASPGRMSLAAAISFSLLGFAMALLRHRPAAVVAQSCALLSATLSLLTLNSYLLGVHDFPGIERFSAMAVYTAAGLLLLSLGVLFCSQIAALCARFLPISRRLHGPTPAPRHNPAARVPGRASLARRAPRLVRYRVRHCLARLRLRRLLRFCRLAGRRAAQ